ncbi:phosphoribulokinase [uncultured Sulfitobacter sp.]|uniref:phosphoribulokinase n=1 Tax=uncultured Sulfitobacter sp. TaxID=191468 RepID=UPI002606F6E5|nr:phosphoribulokinase [uncultured Sulfitobacter sp.]
MPLVTQAQLLSEIERCAEGKSRILIGIAGPPGSGKSTIAEALAQGLRLPAAVVPMDGFHLDNAELIPLGLLERKGAPETFDAAAFAALVRRLRSDTTITYPTFDREADKTVPDGAAVSADTRVLLIEGNYLLLNRAPWSELDGLFDLTVRLDVPRATLHARLVERWRNHGLSPADATARAEGNDMRNADVVLNEGRAADFTVQS